MLLFSLVVDYYTVIKIILMLICNIHDCGSTIKIICNILHHSVVLLLYFIPNTVH